MSNQQKFIFSWRADGTRREMTIPAATYAEACWRLGLLHAQYFRAHGVPPDFKMPLTDEQARLDEPPAESTIEGSSLGEILS